MGIFATRMRQNLRGTGAGRELSDELRLALPPRFEAVGEALASGSGSVDACAVLGQTLAHDGVSLEEALEGLRTTWRLVRGADPGYPDLRAVAVAWGEATLGYLHGLSCEDPLTGLASMAHVRGRLTELYRGQLREAVPVRDSHALVVLDAPLPGAERGHTGRADVLTNAHRVIRLGEVARTVFAGAETVARLGPTRVTVLAGRDRLGKRIALLHRLLTGFDLEGIPVRVWIEGLPDNDPAAAQLLDELTRP